MNPQDTEVYRLVLGKLEGILGESRFVSGISFVPSIKKSLSYSMIDPAISFGGTTETPLIVWDIELFIPSDNIIIQKWVKHSQNCSTYLLWVPYEIKEQIERTCLSSEMVNYEVKTFRVEKKKTRNIIIDSL